MIRPWPLAIITFALGLALGLAIPHLCAARSRPGDAEAVPGNETFAATAEVAVQPVRAGSIERALTGLGVVGVAAEATTVIAAPFECLIRRLTVTAGGDVAADAVVVEIEPSPQTRAQFSEADKALAASDQDLALAQRRLGLHLGTNLDVLQAQHARDAAAQRHADLAQRGFGQVQQLRAGVAGLVARISAQEGQLVAMGAELVAIAAHQRLETRLGLEPGEATALRIGSPMTVTSLRRSGAPTATAAITGIGRALNPTSRLIDVVVALPADAGFLFGEAVRGRAGVPSISALVVPRQAVRPDGDDQVLFTVSAGVAHRHLVEVVAENDEEVAFTGAGIAVGDSVVTIGNGVLDDGMAVTTAESARPPGGAAP